MNRAPAPPIIPVAPPPAASVEPVADMPESGPRRGLFRRMLDAVRGVDESESPPDGGGDSARDVGADVSPAASGVERSAPAGLRLAREASAPPEAGALDDGDDVPQTHVADVEPGAPEGVARTATDDPATSAQAGARPGAARSATSAPDAPAAGAGPGIARSADTSAAGSGRSVARSADTSAASTGRGTDTPSGRSVARRAETPSAGTARSAGTPPASVARRAETPSASAGIARSADSSAASTEPGSARSADTPAASTGPGSARSADTPAASTGPGSARSADTPAASTGPGSARSADTPAASTGPGSARSADAPAASTGPDMARSADAPAGIAPSADAGQGIAGGADTPAASAAPGIAHSAAASARPSVARVATDVSAPSAGTRTAAGAPGAPAASAGRSIARAPARPSIARTAAAQSATLGPDAAASPPPTGADPAFEPPGIAPSPRGGADGPSLARAAYENGAPEAIGVTAGRGALTRSAARPAMTTKRVARAAAPHEGRARPHLGVVDTPPAPRLARSAAERIAENTGGAIETGEGGLQTVHFPAPAISQAPVTISRELSEGGGSAPAPAETTSAPESGGAPGADREELYEYFLDRLKRDLVAEREQMGHLINDNP